MRTSVRRCVAVALAAVLLVPLPAGSAAASFVVLAGTLDPAVLDVGVLLVPATSAPKTVTYTNLNPGPVTIVSISTTTSSPYATWTVTSTDCTAAPVPGGGSCTIAVVFGVGYKEGRYRGTLTVVDGSPTGVTATLVARAAWPPGDVDWGPVRTVRGSGTSEGGGLARTVSSSAETLHAVFSGDSVAGVPVAETGPYRLVAYTRSVSDGESWSTPIRLNPATQHGTDPTVAGGTSAVYVAWVKLAHVGLDSLGPRILYVRVNRDHGRGPWESARRLSPLDGRVMGPRAAAALAYGYVACTDAVTGAVRVARTADGGRTWTTATLGSTTRGTTARHDAGVSISARERLVVVSWVANASGTVKARVSLDGGRSWLATDTVGAGADPGTTTATATRVGGAVVAWVDETLVRYVYTAAAIRPSGAVWKARTLIPGLATRDYLGVEAVAVGYPGPRDMGFAMVACYESCDPADPAYRRDLIWREAVSVGSFFFGPNRLTGTGIAISAIGRPSVVFVGATLRFVAAQVRDTVGGRERLVLRAGTGEP